MKRLLPHAGALLAALVVLGAVAARRPITRTRAEPPAIVAPAPSPAPRFEPASIEKQSDAMDKAAARNLAQAIERAEAAGDHALVAELRKGLERLRGGNP